MEENVAVRGADDTVPCPLTIVLIRPLVRVPEYSGFVEAALEGRGMN